VAPLVFVVAGEPSGDALGGALMAAMKRETGGSVRFAGIGGPAMTEQGLDSLFPMAELSVMGLVEVLPSLRRILRRIDQTVSAIRELQPDVVVTIDSQGFSYRVAKRLKPAPCPVVHYVAPTVWAWKPWRARHLAQVVDRVLLLFPFEKPWWDAVRLDAVEVGHPAAEMTIDEGARRAMRHRLLAEREGPLLVVLPGSRTGVVRRHLPVFGEAVARLAVRHPGLAVALPTVGTVAGVVRAAVADWPVPATVVDGPAAERLLVMAAGDAALAASGTVALELAAAATPHVIAYRANALTAAIVRRMVSIPYASPVNLVAGRAVTPELIQERCTPSALAESLDALLADGTAARAQKDAMAEVMVALGRGGDTPPSQRAARAVLEMVGKGRAAST